MAHSIAQKLRIREGMTLRTIHAPEDFSSLLEPLPVGVTFAAKGKNGAQVHWFVTSRAQLEKEMDDVISMLREDVICWTYYPKISSGIRTDLTRDKGWDALLRHEEMHWISLISFNEIWSAFGFRLKNEGDLKKEAAKPNVREIFDYVDPVGKTVRLPEDLAAALQHNEAARERFEGLSFTNKKEYIEWVITAKREATRQVRVDGTVMKLLQGWKNPANR